MRALQPHKRGFRRQEAAEFIGVSPSKFDELVRDGRIPPPFSIDGCRVWDVYELHAAFDNLKTPAKVMELDRL